MIKFKEHIKNFAKSGMLERHDPELIRKVVMINVICIIAVFVLVPLGVAAFMAENITLGILDQGFAAVLVVLLIYLRRTKNFDAAARLGTIFAGGLFLYCLVSGGVKNTGFVWYYTFPLFASFLLGSKRGLIASLLLLIPALLVFAVDIPISQMATYTKEFKIRFIPSYLVVLLYAFLFERIRERTQEKLTLKNQELNKNIDDLNQTELILQHERGELERRVNDRTRALKEANDVLLEEMRERERAQGALKEAFDIINMSPSVAFLWKNEEGWPVEFVSDNVEKLLGHTADELMSGQVVYETAIHPEDLERVSDEVKKYSVTGGIAQFKHRPYRIVTRTGKVKWVDDKTYIRRNQQGDITHYQGMVEDVTDRILAELALLEIKEDLELKVGERTLELSKANEDLRSEINEHEVTEKKLLKAKQVAETANQAKSEFLANMSHELRTPLNHILGFTEMIVDGQFGSLNETQIEYLSDVLQSSRHLHALINDILDLSKVEAGKLAFEPSEVDLKGILKNSLVLVKEKALNHKIQLDLEIKEIPLTIEADERKLKQIMYNLLSNAAKFTPDGGAIQVKAKGTSGESEGTQGKMGSANGRIEISVQDTGIGMDKNDLERVFRPFEQVEHSASRKFHGTGLGLSLTRDFVELHGGRIWAESDGIGKGSTFWVVIPAKQGEISP